MSKATRIAPFRGKRAARFALKLYTYFRSSAAFRVRIALNLKRLGYEPQFVHLAKGEHRRPEYAKVNPQGLVPTLVTDAGARLTQSLAIMEYLDEAQPSPALLPKDALGRARVRALAQIVACEIHPLNNLRTLQYLKRSLGQNEEQINSWYRHWIADGLAKLEAALGDGGAGKFSHGDAPGMADCCLVPQIFNAKRYNCELDAYPTTMRIFGECMKHEAFERAQPSRQPDAE
jgi:maleylacetoacetate isomerase